MSEFRNTITYSTSRDRILRSCPRKYWYHVYASWRGWWRRGKPPTDRRAEDTYQARFFDNIPALTGRIVHDQAARMLRGAQEGRRWVDANGVGQTLLRNTRSDAEHRLNVARGRRYVNPKVNTRLLEFELGGEVDDFDFFDRVRTKTLSIVSPDECWNGMEERRNLFLHAITNGKSIVLVEDLVTYHVNGVQVWLQVDMMMRSDHDPVHDCVIVDWKTGRPKPEDVHQAELYGHWAWMKGWTGAQVIMAYLKNVDSVELRAIEMNRHRVVSAEARIARFIDDIRSRIVDGDILRNEPIEERFEAIGSPVGCAVCEFQAICGADGTKPSWVDR